MLFLDGVDDTLEGDPCSRCLKPPAVAKIEKSVHRTSHRVDRYQERAGLLVRDMENSYLTLEARFSSALDDRIGLSVSYRIAFGPHHGQNAFTLQTIPAHTEESDDGGLGKAAGFSRHCGDSTGAHQRVKLEWLCCYSARSAIANYRLSLTRQGNVRYQLKTPYRAAPRTHLRAA